MMVAQSLNDESRSPKNELRLVSINSSQQAKPSGDRQGTVATEISRTVRFISRCLFLAGVLFLSVTIWSTKSELDYKVLSLISFIAVSSQDEVTNMNIVALEKAAGFALVDKDIRYLEISDAGGNAIVKLGVTKFTYTRQTKQVFGSDGKTIGNVVIEYSNARVIWLALLFLIPGVIGLFWLQSVMKSKFNSVMDKIIEPVRKVVGSLSQTSDIILNNSSRLVDSSQSLTSVVAEQSSATTITAEAINEMAKMVTRTVEQTKTSCSRMNEVERKTERGAHVVRKVVATMEQIESATEDLRKVHKVVDDIAAKSSIINDIVFQAKLLSFNASVEAARSGEHGRGFAVVAGEIGHLAQVSGTAAREINELIVKSREHVVNVVNATTQRISEIRAVNDETIRVFSEIAAETRSVTSQIQQIDHAAVEQNAGVKSTAEAITRIEQISLRTTNISQEVNQAAVDLNVQSLAVEKALRELNELI